MPEMRPHDMRAEVRQRVLENTWWNRKAGLFAHAVAAAMDGQGWASGLRDFESTQWHHRTVNRFAYVQIKKTGGGGVSDPAALRLHAERYADVLEKQLSIYRPHLVLGCGVGSGSPARLLDRFVLPGGAMQTAKATGATWWEFESPKNPRALVQLWHPARRGVQAGTYKDVYATVREVARAVGLGR